ncbi:Rho termination factor N-terminal domain-containing protein [Enterococcus faecalis]|uniref:Rho termination factor N-terminal domain-containing protein n=1 Tax=Enterococcus faecalis TaxID=1351 RepID=UPI001F4C2C1B|nr:Rho termination factor N-terminal domain-containing protein [Enterococcus faecalis]MEB7953769.1 Rho termination factor N-terminal domain-containing protein [Enterococcus faecalis]MEB7963968.1 Rho termination factor N-terminal domain-containing protein [Enterococcus faecalis]UNB72336.1 Rho termination factor N-terminal domain-containing protein [Enterococcus faecalis]
MRVLIRSSASGSEYWDTEEKRNVFVPKGQEPDFEVTENPESMLSKEADLYVSGLPITVGNVTVDTDGIKGERLLTTASADDEEPDEIVPSDESVVLEEMNVKELREYAKRKGIEIPSAVRAKGEILNIIKESE